MYIVHCFLSVLLLYPVITLANPAVLEHDLHVEIDDSTRSFLVRDRIRADPSGAVGGSGIPDISLDPGMRITSLAFDGQSADDPGRGGGALVEVPSVLGHEREVVQRPRRVQHGHADDGRHRDRDQHPTCEVHTLSTKMQKTEKGNDQ